jgi:UDP-N-acetylmuramate dehydrogenase
MLIQQNYNLKHIHTFQIPVHARFFTEFCSIQDLCEGLELSKSKNLPFLILGGGSNILFTKDYEGIILKNSLKGKEILYEDENEVLIKVYGGENWHDLVHFCVKNHWGGIENLALIPGTVGAAPIQNIGAYGVEIQEVLTSVDALHIHHYEIHHFLASDCQFGYRDSIFKKKFKGQYVIISITLKLQKNPKPNYSYSDVYKYLQEHQLTPNLQNIFEAVINIRKEKLPDPQIIGNAGSFFKNPFISAPHFDVLIKKYPNIPYYKISEEIYKIPAAWLIEQCGWKGYREGDAGVHPKQALVLVNYSNASGQQIVNLAQKIMESVKKKFQIELEPEVNIL